jgi:hypothetical protein
LDKLLDVGLNLGKVHGGRGVVFLTPMLRKKNRM